MMQTDAQGVASTNSQKQFYKNKWFIGSATLGVILVAGAIAWSVASRPTLPVPLTAFWNGHISSFESEAHVQLQPKTTSDGYVHYFGQSGQSTIEVVAEKSQEPQAIYVRTPEGQSQTNQSTHNQFVDFFSGVTAMSGQQMVQLVDDWDSGKQDVMRAGEWTLAVSPNHDGTVSIFAGRGNFMSLKFLTPQLLAGATMDTASGMSGTVAHNLTISVIDVFPLGTEANVHVTVTNNTNESVYVSALDFTLSMKDGNTVSAADDSYRQFQGVTLQPGQKMDGTLAFNASSSDATVLNYNGLSGAQQVSLTDGSGS